MRGRRHPIHGLFSGHFGRVPASARARAQTVRFAFFASLAAMPVSSPSEFTVSESATTTPQSKRRRQTTSAIEQSLSNTLESQRGRDIKYITETLEAGGTPLIQYIASLLRDGVLQRAMDKAGEAPTPARLGRKLPAKVRKLKALPFLFKREVVISLVGCFADPPQAQPGQDEPLGADEVLRDGEQVNTLLRFALNADLDMPIPSTHAGAGFERPLMAVLQKRASLMGNRLWSLSAQDISQGNFGYFSWNRATPAAARSFDGRDIVVPIAPALLTNMTDLELVDGCSHQVRLESPSTGFSHNLMMLLRNQHGLQAPDETSPFEHPEVCTEYEGLVVPVAAVSGSASAPAIPKARPSRARGLASASASAPPRARLVANSSVPTS